MHTPLSTLAGISATGIAIFLLLHLIVWRLLPPGKKGVLLLLKIALLSFALAVAAAAFFVGNLDSGVFAVSLPVFGFCILGYLHLYVGTFRSLSVRILEEIDKSPNKSLTLQELNAVYPTIWMFTSRLDILEQNGWITLRGTAYECTKKGHYCSQLIQSLRKLYGISSAG